MPIVSNFILRDGVALAADQLSASDAGETFARLTGHFALHLRGEGTHLLARDLLGVNKLFFAVGPQGEVDSSSYFHDLVRRGHAPARIWSVPSGHLVRISPDRRALVLEKYSPLTFADDAPAVDAELPRHAARIRQRLEATFQALGRALAGRRVYVTLSGGLDSTTVAALASAHIADLTAITFAVAGASPRRPRDGDGFADGYDEGSDLRYASRVAAALGIPLHIVEVGRDALVELLDDVLLYGQDYRDFNVHCGLVNAALGRAIATLSPASDRAAPGDRPVVLTGDTMNELMADYTPVQYAARDHYALPRLAAGRLRRFLVGGLDSGDREVGIFARWGIDTVQPYALIPDAYTTLPGGFLEATGAKQRLARLVMGERVPDFIYDRPKVRAQVGGSEEVGGTLAAMVDRGIDGAELERRFRDLVGFDAPELRRWIRAGVYRFTTSYPGD